LQVSHHPPICAAHADNAHFEYDLVSAPTTKFLGNSLEVYPYGARMCAAMLLLGSATGPKQCICEDDEVMLICTLLLTRIVLLEFGLR
jgi:hypothetical protein